MMNRFRFEADVPSDLVQDLLQTIRTWEQAHPHVQMAIVISDGPLATREALGIFRSLVPALVYEKIVEED
jgi:hypothetical protein